MAGLIFLGNLSLDPSEVVCWSRWKTSGV